MPRGGHANSGPKPDPDSGRSDRRGYSLTALPSQGYKGEAPEWPLMKRTVYYVEYVDKKPERHLDESATRVVAEREGQLWGWAWSTPQACAWSMPSEHWRLMTIAMWVRTMVICESSDATAADKNSLHRFADQIGMTDAGLATMGWKVAIDEVAAKASEPKAAPTNSARSRFKVVASGDA